MDSGPLRRQRDLHVSLREHDCRIENVTSSESNIRDADFAQETSNLTRAQILTQAGTSVLATANSTPQSVLTLLGR
jgi:flagellin